MTSSAAAPAPEIHLTLGSLRQMKNLPEEWQMLVDDSHGMPDECLVTVTEKILMIAARDLI